MRRALFGWTAVALAGSLGWAPAGEVTVTPIVKDGTHVFVSFSASSSFDDEAKRIVQSGLLLTFNYLVDLSRPAFFFDHRLCATSVGASVTFDSLTARYQVQRLRDGRVTKSERVEKETEVQDWMTAFDQVPLDGCEPLEPNADYYVRVRLRTSPPRPTFPLWPFGRDDASGRKDFTFVR